LISEETCLTCSSSHGEQADLTKVTMEKEKSDQIIGIRIPSTIAQRLDTLAKRTGRTKTFYIREAIVDHLDDLEDIYFAEMALERVRRGDEELSSLDEVERRLGLED
jgi:RHH-type transcriptional regulator, rel operon repressor / antitoxin RelB